MRIAGVCLSAAGACLTFVGGVSIRQASLRMAGRIAASEAWALNCVLTVTSPFVSGSGASLAVKTARVASWVMYGAVGLGLILLACGMYGVLTEHDQP